MNMQWLDLFLYKPAKLRYSLITIIFIIIWLVCYFLVIVPIKDQLNNALYEQEVLKNDIALLAKKIVDYPSSQQLVAQVVDLKNDIDRNHISLDKQLNQISQLLLTSPLKLVDFDNQSVANQWNFKLQGSYIDFVSFFSQLVELNLNIDICNMLIHRQKNNLDFALCLQHSPASKESL